MRFKSGDNAVDFNIRDLNGNSITLADFKDDKVLLSFYRYASCPLCNLRIHALINRYDEFNGKGLKIIAFFESPKESMVRYVAGQNPPFPLVPDPDRTVYKKYRVEKSVLKYIKGVLNTKLIRAAFKGFMIGKMENDKTMVPADFLIKDGIIHTAYYGKDISDHIPFEHIENFLD